MPMITGCPGRTATPCTSSVPASRTARAVKSRDPAEEPASASTRSCAAVASTMACRMASGSSGSAAQRVNSPHAARTCAPSTMLLYSITSCGNDRRDQFGARRQDSYPLPPHQNINVPGRDRPGVRAQRDWRAAPTRSPPCPHTSCARAGRAPPARGSRSHVAHRLRVLVVHSVAGGRQRCARVDRRGCSARAGNGRVSVAPRVSAARTA